MAPLTVLRRPLLWVGTLWRVLRSVPGVVADLLDFGDDVDPHTRVTFRAVVDAVVPETPALADDLGPEHVPGGLAVDLETFLVAYLDAGFQFGLPYLGSHGNVPLAAPVANVLDVAATTLIERGDLEAAPDPERAKSLLGPDDPPPSEIDAAIGPFARLSHRDRLRAIGVLDEFEIDVSPAPDELFELDAGLVGQLVVGFTELIYYSEWQGYDEFLQPPSERSHPNDPAAVQSWRQTGFPGFADGYAALRGYAGKDDSPLGGGETWTTIDEEAGVRITLESGEFRDDDYDTSDYEEPFPAEDAPPVGGEGR